MASTNDSQNLYELAIDAHQAIMKLQAGLASAGAEPPALHVLDQMAGMTATIAKSLGPDQGPVGAHPTPGAAMQQQAAPQPAAAPAAAPSGPMPGERPNGLDPATRHLQAAVKAGAAVSAK